MRITHTFAAALVALLVGPGARADDAALDAGFAASASPPNWQRSYVAGGGTVDERIVAAARAPDGGYVVAGRRAGGGAGALIFLAKFRPDGSYDSSFGGTVATGSAGTGRVLKDAYLSSVRDMTIDAQGRVIVIGATPGALGQNDYGVVRFNANGSDDTTFAGDGGTAVAFDYDAANNRVNDVPDSVTTLPDGSVIVAGSISDANSGTPFTSLGLVKLKPDGSRDTSFSTSGNGTALYCRAQCDNVVTVARVLFDAPRNRLIIGGDYQAASNNTDWFIITRDLATSSSQTFTYVVDQGGASGYQLAYMTALAVQADGKPVALGWANDAGLNSVPVVLRRLAGSVAEDTGFGNVAGRGLFVESGLAGAIYNGLAIDSLGRILLAGEYAPARTGIVVRLTPAGATDIEFNNGYARGYYAPTSGTSNSWRTRFRGVFLDAGRPVLAGESPDSTTADTDYDMMLTRLQSDLIFANGLQ